MKNDEDYIEAAPVEEDIEEILVWLKRECDINGVGFYNNKNIIVDSFHSGNAIVLKHRGENIGLVTWSRNEILVNIDIFVIDSSYRGKGYGNFFFQAISEYFRNKGFKAIKLFCEPKSSERFWIKMGFKKLPYTGRSEHELTYYGVLVNTASITSKCNTDKIELWDVEPYEVEKEGPKWTWYLEKQNEELLYPIIQPCDCNWNLRWSRNGQVIKEDKVKYFTDKDYELYSYPFLYINKLEE
ncbi:GNAT family N-acetyltransferase [Fusibacter tunisiensis]|uniref:GNAT superfamily N-acetyltransferase n=1 Tax=Fusibacter tunisiensis TaxID=1008308 RepID=A0ABS2MQB8_9FIRM|nr:GNAT family N-acetyltransferase [Fusibacter tunisiensis]MBM7561512.1 GNAT superfamily N-acetyltransferase [Fusibacter tunisiensis]